MKIKCYIASVASDKSVRSSGRNFCHFFKRFKVAEKYATLWSHYKTFITSIKSSAVNNYIDSLQPLESL